MNSGLTLPICAILLVLVAMTTASGQAVLPSDFVDEAYATGTPAACGLDFLPDGRLISVSRSTGGFYVTPAGGGASVQFGTLGNLNGGPPGERGLTGIAVDPQWPMRPYLYIVYTSLAPANVHISMLTITGTLNDPNSSNLSIASEYFLIDDIADQNNFHNAGKCRFGPDGFLYVSFGDDETYCAAQDPDILLGKIVRLDVSNMPGSGSGPPPRSALAAAGNPHIGTNAQLVWAHGLRNPHSFHIDPLTGELWIAEVGHALREEVNRAPIGGLNFGWPVFEGTTTCGGCSSGCSTLPGPFESPFIEIPHGTLPISVLSFGLYRNQSGMLNRWGSDFEGDYFHVLFHTGEVFRSHWNGASYDPPVLWATGLNRPTEGLVGPDGSLYYPTNPYGSGGIRRIRRDYAAAVTSVGTGCVGSTGQALTLSAVGLPTLGNLGFGVSLANGVTGASAQLYLAASMAPSPLVLGAGCEVYIDTFTALFFINTGVSPVMGSFDAAGTASFPLPIPNLPELNGLEVSLQALGVDLGSSLGFTLSNGLELEIGL